MYQTSPERNFSEPHQGIFGSGPNKQDAENLFCVDHDDLYAVKCHDPSNETKNNYLYALELGIQLQK